MKNLLELEELEKFLDKEGGLLVHLTAQFRWQIETVKGVPVAMVNGLAAEMLIAKRAMIMVSETYDLPILDKVLTNRFQF